MNDTGPLQRPLVAASARNEIIACVLLIALTGMAYAGVLTNGFVNFDDNIYVTANSSVQQGLTARGIKYAWTTFDSGNYHPLTWLSLEADCSLYGLKPAGFHATNLLLHLVNSVLLLMLLRRMTGALVPSAAVALLFALHPLHVESVAWVSERKDVLSTFFLILAVWAYQWYAAKPAIGRHLVVSVLMLLGLLSKSMLVSLPLLLLLLDVWPLKRIDLPGISTISGGVGAGVRIQQSISDPRPSFPALLYEKSPWCALSVLWVIVTIVSQGAAGSFDSMQGVPLVIRIGNAFNAYAWYLGKTFWPTDLVVFYPHPQASLSLLMVGVGVATLTVVSLLIIALPRGRAPLAVGWLWFLVSLVPVIGIVQVGSQAYADRYTYVPHIGLFSMLIFGLYESVTWRGAVRGLAGLVFAGVILGCLLLTRTQVTYWRDGETLWQHALAVNPQNFTAYMKLGILRLEHGQYDGAADYFGRAVRLKPKAADAHANLGVASQGLQRLAEAEQEYATALRLNPRHGTALNNLAGLLKARGDLRGALPLLATLVELQPKAPDLRSQYALVLGRLGELDEAANQFSIVLRQDPESPVAENNLGTTLMQLGRDADAKPHIERALQLAPKFASAHFNLAELLEREKDFSGAQEHFAEVLRLSPNDAEARQRLQKLEQRGKSR